MTVTPSIHLRPLRPGAHGPYMTVEDALERSDWFLRYALDHPDGHERPVAFHAHGQAALTQHIAMKAALELA